MQKMHVKAPAAAIRRYQDWRFGMFIHYGLYSLLGRHEWVMYYERVPPADYRRLQDRFQPALGCVRQWLELAKSCGMRYACLTARHHEGFCLFDTRTTTFNASVSPAGRDLVAEYADACRELGLGVGLYYSVADWSDPGFIAGPAVDPAGWQRFVATAHAQLEELMSGYGTVDYLFYDGCPPPGTWGAREINARIRELQPSILISDRCSLEEDVASAEGHTIADPGRPWEAGITLNNSWGYAPGDPFWKEARELARILAVCCHENGNLLLNVGPAGDGFIPAKDIALLTELGDWVERHAEAIYGTRPHPFDYAVQKLATSRGNVAYLPLHIYSGPRTVIGGLGNRVLQATLLGNGQLIAFRQEADRLFLDGLPEETPESLLPVVRLELDGEPRGVRHPLLSSARFT